MEFAANGDIMGYCEQNPGVVPLKKAYHWFRQSCEGLDYLHNTLFMAHRALKLENILLDKHFAKISDFSFAKKSFDKEKMEIILSTTFCPSYLYCT